MRRVRNLLLLLILLLQPALVHAEYDKTFSWKASDEDALLFRYQLDGESADGWTIVPAAVTSYTATGLSGEHVFYVQQSDDGIFWSQSSLIHASEPASAVSEPPSAPALEDEEEPAYTYPLPETFTVSLLYGTGSLYDRSAGYDFESFIAELSLTAGNLRAQGHFGFDLRLDLGARLCFGEHDFRYYFMPLSNLFDASAYGYCVYADLEGGGNFSVKNATLYLAAGPRLQLNFGSYDTEGAYAALDGSLAYKWGLTADAGVRFGFSQYFSAGAEVSFTVLFDGSERGYIDYKLLFAGSF